MSDTERMHLYGNDPKRIHSMNFLRAEIVMAHTAYTRWTGKKS